MLSAEAFWILMAAVAVTALIVRWWMLRSDRP
jgi:hypothetical protein